MTRPGSEGGGAGTRSEASAGRAELTRSAFANAKSRGKKTKMAKFDFEGGYRIGAVDALGMHHLSYTRGMPYRECYEHACQLAHVYKKVFVFESAFDGACVAAIQR